MFRAETSGFKTTKTDVRRKQRTLRPDMAHKGLPLEFIHFFAGFETNVTHPVTSETQPTSRCYPRRTAAERPRGDVQILHLNDSSAFNSTIICLSWRNCHTKASLILLVLWTLPHQPSFLFQHQPRTCQDCIQNLLLSSLTYNYDASNAIAMFANNTSGVGLIPERTEESMVTF